MTHSPYAGLSWKNRVVVVIDTSKGHIDTPDQLVSVLNFLKAFTRVFNSKKMFVSIIQKNGPDVITLLKLDEGRSLPILDSALSPKNFKIGKPGSQSYQVVLQTVLDAFSTGVFKTAIIFTKDGSKVTQSNVNFEGDNIVVIPVVIGDKTNNKVDEINGVFINDVKMLPSVYGTLESVIKERHGILSI